jgi:FKBP-type peptidyl-prolyl cis-trans isomerase SlyD
MIVSKDKVVSLTYELRLNSLDGDVVESLTEDSPLTFLYGGGGLLPKFEENISGLGIGARFNFELPSTDAYGEVNKDAIVDVPIDAFEMDGKIDYNLLRIGNKIPMQDSSGNKLTGIVQEISTERVRMDFNHPLAGNNLHFNGMITEIREATEEELHHGHAHYPGSCEGCSHCGGEGDQCC